MPDVDVHSLPPEIWREIITRACSDGGYTGRSLALTSTFFQTQSLSARFHSLSFNTLSRIEHFLAFISCQSARCNPHIEHLFLHFHEDPVAPLSLSWHGSSIMSREEREQWDARYLAAMRGIISLAAPTLRTFCIIEHHDLSLPPLPCAAFPKLEELTLLHHSGSMLLLQMDATLRETVLAKLPRLRRFHLIGTHSYSIPALLALLTILASQSLTHFRLSGITSQTKNYAQIPAALAEALTVTLGQVTGEGQDIGDSSRMDCAMPSLKRVIVHNNAPPPTAARDERWYGFLDKLHWLARACHDQTDIQMLLMVRPWQRDARWPDRLFRDWLERMQGGVGCWVSAEDEEETRESLED